MPVTLHGGARSGRCHKLRATAVRSSARHNLRGQLSCTDATIRNDSGPALLADRLQVDQGVSLPRLEAVGTGELGAVRLLGAHLGLLDCTGATLRNDTGPALHAHGLQVDQDVFLRSRFEAVGAGSDVTLNLSQARIGGVLEFAPARLEHTADPQARLALDGLTYAGLPVGISSRDWLCLLREGTKSSRTRRSPTSSSLVPTAPPATTVRPAGP